MLATKQKNFDQWSRPWGVADGWLSVDLLRTPPPHINISRKGSGSTTLTIQTSVEKYILAANAVKYIDNINTLFVPASDSNNITESG